MKKIEKWVVGAIALVLLLGAVGVMDVGVGAVAPVVDNNAAFGTTGNSVKVSNVGGTTFVVSWVTDLVSNGTVRVYNSTANASLNEPQGVFVDDGRASTYNAYGGEALVKSVWDDIHVVYVTGLSESTNYWFQVESTTQGGSYPADTVVDDNSGSFYSFNSGTILLPSPVDADDYVVVTSDGVTPVDNVLVVCNITHTGVTSLLYHQWTRDANGIADFGNNNFRSLTAVLAPCVGDPVHVEAWGGALGNASWDGTWNGTGAGGGGPALATLTLTSEELAPPPANNPPTLSGGTVNPLSGDTATTFTYNVTYTDVDGNPPSSGYPKVHILKTASEIGGSPFAMTWQSGANNTGANYTCQKVGLAEGSDYTYYFNATDGTDYATELGPLSGPTVSVAVTTGTISGTVINFVSEEGIPGVTVTAYNTGTTTIASTTTTGSDGTYSMELDASTYDVEASAAGYETSPKRTENVIAGANTPNVNFALTAEAVDATGPTITAPLPADDSTVGTGTPIISANYSDPSGINISSVVLKVDDVDVTSNATVTVTGVSYTPAAALSEGEHTVYLEVKDASNNSNAANTTWSFTVDTESPLITHTTVINATAGEKITITATITDTIGLTAASVFYRVAGTENYVAEAMICILSDGVPTNNYTFDIPASVVTTAGVEYYIWAKDGVNNATDGTAALPHSVDVSPPPNQEPILSNAGVSPTSGKTDTTFTFSVTYTDPDNNAPTIKNVYIDDVAHEMSSTDTDYTDGAVFTYSTTLSKGSHTYYFEFKDETASVRLPTSGTNSGPSVTEKASKPGFIPGIGIIGTSLAMLGAALIIWKKRKTG